MRGHSHTLPIEELLRQRDWVRGVARALVFGDQDADDLEQEAWLAALKASVTRESVSRGWLATVLRRTAARLGGRDRRRHENEHVAATAPARAGPPAADVVAQAEWQERVVRSVLALAEPYRETVLLRFYEDLSLRDIAARMDTPLETVRTRLRRGLGMLRARFEEKGADAWRHALLPLAGASTLRTGGSIAAGALLMSKTTAVSVVALALVVSVAVWFVASGRLESAANDADAARIARQDPPPPAGPAAPRSQDSSAKKSGEAPIVPTPFVEKEEAPASSPSSIGAAATRIGAAIEGEVLSPDGLPVAGAAVIVGDPAKESLSEESILRNQDFENPRIPKVTTSSKGTFSFDQVPPSGKLTVAASHPDFGLVLAQGIPSVPGEKRFVTLRFESALRIFGRVTDGARKPIASADVRITPFKADGWSNSTNTRSIKTDADGSYRVDPIAGVKFVVEVEAPRFYSTHQWVNDVKPSEKERRVDFQLETSPLLRGKLVLADGSPAMVAERMAALFGRDGPADAQQRLILIVSQDDPRKDPGFRSMGREAGRIDAEKDVYELAPQSKGIRFLSLWLGSGMLGMAEIPASNVGPDIVVDWSKAPKPKARGVLALLVRSAEDKSPVTKYYADIRSPRDVPMFENLAWGHRVTAPDGRFRFDRFPEGRYQLSVTADGYAEAKSVVDLKPGPEATEVTVDLVAASRSAANASVSGVVHGSSGEPMNGVTVWIVPERSERSADAVRTETNADGAFRFEKLQQDAYFVIAEGTRTLAPAWTRAVAQPSVEGLVLTLSAGVEVQVIPAGTNRLAFRVIDSSGVAVVDDVRSGTRHFGDSHTLMLMPGRYELRASSPGFEPARAEFTAASGADVRVTLTRKKD